MRWDRNHKNRKSPRLKGWDYRTPAWYFVTIVTKNRRHFFGEIRDGIVGLSNIGCIAWQNWEEISIHFDHIKLDEFIVMPNHVHGLIGIMEWPVPSKSSAICHGISQSRTHGTLQGEDKEIKFGNPKSGSLSTILNQYKASVTREARRNDDYEFCWQGRFHDHIVRNGKELSRIRDYIYNNPAEWDGDRFY